MAIQAPSFVGLRPASDASSRCKASIVSRNTRPEKKLRRELWKSGLHFRVNVKTLPGCPDIVFNEAKVAVFCDGDFWHGRQWKRRRSRLRSGHNSEYWCRKIEANIKRDRTVNNLLRDADWTVLRFWESNIKRDPAEVVRKINNEQKRKGRSTSSQTKHVLDGLPSNRYKVPRTV